MVMAARKKNYRVDLIQFSFHSWCSSMGLKLGTERDMHLENMCLSFLFLFFSRIYGILDYVDVKNTFQEYAKVRNTFANHVWVAFQCLALFLILTTCSCFDFEIIYQGFLFLSNRVRQVCSFPDQSLFFRRIPSRC